MGSSVFSMLESVLSMVKSRCFMVKLSHLLWQNPTMFHEKNHDKILNPRRQSFSISELQYRLEAMLSLW